MAHRRLTRDEIIALQSRGCTGTQWNSIRVKDGFDPSRIRDVHFSGEIVIGQLEGCISFEADTRLDCGITDTHLHNCVLGDHVCIRHVGLLSNCLIEDHAIIMHTRAIQTTKIQAFGNGISINVLNEAGGRSLVLTDNLSAQIAYLMVMYRHDVQLIAGLEKMLLEYAGSKRTGRCTIGQYAVVLHCNEIKNVQIGVGAMLRNTQQLEDGTVASTRQHPTHVGAGVIARNFIIQEGAHVDTSSVIERSLVGQGVHVGKQFSMTDCVFFSNAEAYHGEAVGIFGGPHTVTHHKSTLLIAAMFSFFNAGSGSNQSNHMYRLGPLHQGIAERGTKTGSFSYMRWPGRVGAFSMVLDRHGSHFDTTEFPFSYLTAEDGRTQLIPGLHFFSAGVHRDAAKWPSRDRRPGKGRLDLIHYDLLSPYTMQQVMRALDVLERLLLNMKGAQQALQYKGVRIKRAMIRAGIKYYRLLVPYFIGNQLVRFASGTQPAAHANDKDLIKTDSAPDAWSDVGGLLASKHRLSALGASIREGRIASVQDMQKGFEYIYSKYEQDSRTWTRKLIHAHYAAEAITPTLLHTIADDWAKSAKTIYNMLLKDARADFEGYSKIGYGIDGTPEDIEKDFKSVRGSAENHPFIVQMTQNLETIPSNYQLILHKNNHAY